MRSVVRWTLFFVLTLACFAQAFAQCNVTLVSPTNGETNVSLTPTLQWNALGGATQYDIFLGVSGSGACAANSPAGSAFGGATFFNAPSLDPGTTYEWKVRAMNGSCPFAESPCQSFTTTTQSCPTITPSLSAPANNAQVNFGAVTLEWTVVPNAQAYEVWLGLDGDNPSPIATTLSSTLTIQVEPGRSVQWWVVAKAPSCTDLTSSPRTFTTNCPTTPPTPQAPPDGATFPANQSITFTWIPIQGATSYDVKISDDGWNSFEVIGENIVGNSFSYAFTAEGDYEWEVRANFDGDCDPLFSARRELVIGANCTGNIPTELISPVNSATARTPVTFQWAARPGAEGYVLLAQRAGDRLPRILATTTGTQFTASDLDGGTYDWWVVTQYPNCPDARSDERILIIESDCPTTRATPQSPANGASNVQSPVTFRWSAVQNARAYRLFASIDGANPVLLGTTTNSELEVPISGGSVIWSVQVVFTDSCATTSETSRFTMARIECPSATINLTAPASGATVNSPVRVAWSAVAGATSYGVWVSVDNSAPLNITRTTNTEATINLPAGEYRWYVDARRGDDCRGVVSDEGRFTVARAANCDANAAPTVTSPLGGTVQSPVTLSWSTVPNAIAYRVWIGRNGAFEDVGFTKNNTLTLPITVAGNYLWFVQALYEGCPAVNSNRGAFVIVSNRVCPTQAPVITSPAANANVSSPVSIVWTAVAGAEKYRVVASKDGGEPVLIGTTEETSLERTLPPGNYAIAVEAAVSECPSTFSARTNFTVPRAQNCNSNAAQPVTPANGATGLTSPVTFAWNPVNGASGYVLVARVNGGSPTALAATTETTVSHEMPPGRVEWWVVKFATGCDPVESQHFVFEIPRTQTECENRRPILLLPGEHSGGVNSPVFLAWTAVPEATGYDVYARRGDVDPNIIATTTEPKALVELPEGTYEWFVVAKFAACNPTRSARGEFTVDPPVPCGTPEQPLAQVVGQALSNTRYRVRWNAVPNASFYEIQESTTLDFANATTFTTDEPFFQFNHEVTGAPVQYLYRVRAISDCNEARGPYSDTVGVFVIAPRTNNASAEIGTEGAVVQTVFLPGGTTPLQFSITTDKPWLTVTPSSGTLPVEGLTVTVTANRNVLGLGTNTGTIKISYSGGSARTPQSHAGTVTSIPLSVSLVTPVVPTGKGTPPPDSLIFPVVGHAQGANDSLFESDIRVTNLTAQTMKYQLNLTPSGTNGTTTGSSSTVEIAPNHTLALDDVVASLFGTGTTSSATGMLEVRPLATSAPATPSFFSSTSAGQTVKNLMTAASSRTYNFTPTGTFGQFIPAIRYADFVGKAAPGLAPTILSLQQVAQSQAYRANFGFAEASGKPAELVVRVYDTASSLLATIPVSLQAGEHKQLNGMLATNGINDLANGRVEVEVLNGDGKVTAYVSEVDNKTNDPLLVSAVVKGATTSNRYVVPGVAFLTNASANWVSDLRIFNAGAATPATLTFYPQGNPSAAVTRDIQLGAGEIEVLDNVLGDLFAQPNGAGGAIAVTTPGFTQLTATARTYNSTATGTYGQYIPGVTPAESVGATDRALQILQLEQSSRLRTNVGLSETAGQSARIEVSVIVPDSIATPVVTIDLQPNEFRQITLGPGGFGLDGVYNARVTVKVVSGNGRVTAYGSTIDAITQDPTYVPAQ